MPHLTNFTIFYCPSDFSLFFTEINELQKVVANRMKQEITLSAYPARLKKCAFTFVDYIINIIKLHLRFVVCTPLNLEFMLELSLSFGPASFSEMSLEVSFPPAVSQITPSVFPTALSCFSVLGL